MFDNVFFARKMILESFGLVRNGSSLRNDKNLILAHADVKLHSADSCRESCFGRLCCVFARHLFKSSFNSQVKFVSIQCISSCNISAIEVHPALQKSSPILQIYCFPCLEQIGKICPLQTKTYFWKDLSKMRFVYLVKLLTMSK